MLDFIVQPPRPMSPVMESFMSPRGSWLVDVVNDRYLVQQDKAKPRCFTRKQFDAIDLRIHGALTMAHDRLVHGGMIFGLLRTNIECWYRGISLATQGQGDTHALVRDICAIGCAPAKPGWALLSGICFLPEASREQVDVGSAMIEAIKRRDFAVRWVDLEKHYPGTRNKVLCLQEMDMSPEEMAVCCFYQLPPQMGQSGIEYPDFA